MSHQIIIPSAGESVTSALISRWHVSDGDHVSKGQVIVTLETDKVSPELEAPVSGTVSISVGEGEEVDIGTVIGEINEGDGNAEVAGVTQAPTSESREGAQAVPTGEVVDVVMPSAGESITSGTVAAWAAKDGEFVARGELLVSVDTDKVTTEVEAPVSGIVSVATNEGTEIEIGGLLGTISASEAPAGFEKPAAPSPVPSVSKPSVEINPSPKPTSEKKVELSVVEDDSRVTRKKMTPLRRKIASHLVNAQQTAAILTTFNEVDMTAVMKLRKSVQDGFVEKHGVKLGFMSLFTKAVVQALKDVPGLNARIDGTDIVENHFYDIGVAIGTDKGLIVPVVRDCDQKSFAEIEKDIIEYATRAKEGKIELSDLSGGVFTISNGGVYGSLLSTPILNPPQSGILGMHTIQQRPVAVDGKVVIRPMMYLAMSYDHRLVDGKEAVTFLIRIKECLENPTRMMLEM